MGNLALQVEGLSKRYRLGAVNPYMELRQAGLHRLRRIKRSLWGQPPPPALVGTGAFWALNDVSFSVKSGETVGVIGRNGAGKSTLLKVLSRITRPTHGRARIYGRLGALLEVGTGFHPELSGRENIHLNATILGLSPTQIADRFDEIVAFAEVEKFLDTPVKHYSSGMYMRLAFAVSAHLEPDILILDEVLAVGDASFQKKCMGKMERVRESGRTVLLVSHSLATIAAFCNRCLLLENGRLVRDGPVGDVCAEYQSMLQHSAVASTQNRIVLGGAAVPTIRDSKAEEGARYGDSRARFTALAVHGLTDEGGLETHIRTGRDIRIEVGVHAREAVNDCNVAIVIYDASGYRLIDANTALHNDYLNLEPGESATVRFDLHQVLLRPGTYKIGLWMGRRNQATFDGITYAMTFEVAMNLETTDTPEMFPGTYLCRFTHAIEAGTPAESVHAANSGKQE